MTFGYIRVKRAEYCKQLVTKMTVLNTIIQIFNPIVCIKLELPVAKQLKRYLAVLVHALASCVIV